MKIDYLIYIYVYIYDKLLKIINFYRPGVVKNCHLALFYRSVSIVTPGICLDVRYKSYS